MSSQDIKARLEQELIASGKYQDIYNFLKIQLANSGWTEKFAELASETIAKMPESQDLRFVELVDKLQPQALSMVPDDVKAQTLAKIKEFLDSVIE
ncbi:hypothetical protein KL930_001540 [Ogataea haglerorum]|uniref:uncharacterized protein n=1 Tax=Ogataea haglerorum TaxID=1937702 RepID=UPI001C8AF111|nr:uncharacterized protein KL911_004386 [Ogataea haglerorum]KAG7692098.1 hypothetical protein KL915_004858 [Ogataea haglerorum]KAG7698762.1 hypothetical protein KL951_002026 [Ogataea haglerorum]KAG7713996.1 hypothetical protein KL913_004687 [Ogataea haglerorum]KAG7714490.1 hypothetical protein KL949_004726 [Ogataea haglerorum]KAG7726011.1 hypothetical protein KL948_004746 [Ogataea haglerorum]